ncbi:MAG: hypothetical protein NTW16_05215 [Bacteroidetes bacterium]|nr:hypothetical protein [Bacteroidota bacterium]
MKKTTFLLAVIAIFVIVNFSFAQKVIIPLTDTVQLEDTYTIIWNGSSIAYRFVSEKWERAANYDYQFSVMQKRYENQWKSVKTLHRMHPDYDGKAGQRDQTMYFELTYHLRNDSVICDLNSSLGKGKGNSDKEFRKQSIEFKVENLSKFAPYDHIRITQEYKYEQGLLQETVLLFKLKDGKEIPFMKNDEKAYFYLKGKLDKAPTLFKE